MFRSSNNFILASDIMENKINTFLKKDKKVIAIIPGPLNKNINKRNKKFNSNKQKKYLVYSGIIDQVKNGGAFISVDLASKLNDINYELHIYGFGEQKLINSLKERIMSNNKSNKTKAFFKGTIPHSELLGILERYDIALPTQ